MTSKKAAIIENSNELRGKLGEAALISQGICLLCNTLIFRSAPVASFTESVQEKGKHYIYNETPVHFICLSSIFCFGEWYLLVLLENRV